jgi:hypothetical protein
MSVSEITVEVQMDSKYNDKEIRVKDTSGNWYGADKTDADKLKSGYKVKILTEKVGEKTILIRKVKVLEEGQPIQKRGGKGGGGGWKQDPDAPARMTISNAREMAREQVKLMIELDIISLGSGSKDKKQAALQALIDALTVRYYEQTMGAQEWVKGMTAQSTESASVEEEPTVEDDDDFGDDDDDDFE